MDWILFKILINLSEPERKSKAHTEEAHLLDLGVEARHFLDKRFPSLLIKIEMVMSR